jgi:hypothetical protein
LFLTTGTVFPAVLPLLQTDADFYLTQIREVIDGHFFVGNPYIQEYASHTSQTLLLPLWITALPGLLGLSIQHMFAVNVVIYTLLYCILLYVVLKEYSRESRWLAVIFSLLGTLYAHDLIIRPAVMQTIYPVFLLFIWLLLLHYRRPQSALPIYLLCAVAVCSFYLYLYLWMLVFSCMGLTILWNIFHPNTRNTRAWILGAISAALCCIPGAIDILQNLRDPLIRESGYRIGLLDSHMLSWDLLWENKYTIVVLLVFLVPHLFRRMQWSGSEVSICTLCLGILGVAGSNLVTGKEMELVDHAARFGLPVHVMAIVHVYTNRQRYPRPARLLSTLAVTAMVLIMSVNIFIRLKPFPYLFNQSAGRYDNIQAYDTPLRILNTVPGEAVILAPEELSTYIAIYTPHYVLHSRYAPFHIAETDELFERFVLEHLPYIDEMLVQERLQDIAGFGPGHEAVTKNTFNAFCRRTHLCAGDGKQHSRMSVAAERGLVGNLNDVRSALSADIDSSLARFAVDYVVIDHNADKNPPRPTEANVLYQDARWEILAVQRVQQ